MNRPTHRLKVLLVCLFWLALNRYEALAAPRLRRDGPVGQRSCTEGQYQPKSSGLCCQLCPAGEHPVSPCTSEGGRSVCQACPAGTFTAHSNHLHFCPSCTPCQKDQEAAQLCSPTTDSVCRCKAGSFCSPDQPCEACHRCRSCKSGETLVKNCTSDANSVCAKSGESPGTPTAGLWWILGFLLFVVAVAVAGVWVYKKKRHWLKFLPSPSPGHSQQDAAGQGSLECTQNARNMSVQISLLPSEDPRGDDSSGLGSSSSESSLTNQHPNPCTPPSPSSARNDDELLHPLNGVKSLKDCFEFFQEEVSCRSYKKFFRSLDLNDNAIDNASKDDIVYELLGVWLQKQGKGASLQHLLGKLRDLDQNQSADAIVKKAIAKGHYERRVTPHPPVDKSDE